MLELVLMLLGVLSVDDPGLDGGPRPPRLDDPDLQGGPRPPR